MEYVTLNNGVEMPLLGFGVMEIPGSDEGEQVILSALSAGYRLIDTASIYANEEIVGAAIKKCGLPRGEFFITTKVWVQDASYDNTKKAFQTSLDKLGLDYLDAYLIHVPFGDYYGSWRAMEELYDDKKIRAIGVCNFYPGRLADLCMNARVVPAINQVEIHPFFQQANALANMKEFGVQSQAWGPLDQGRHDIFNNEVLTGIAAQYGKSVGQIVLRWHVQRGVVAIPKSSNKERIQQNIAIWDFSLSEKDMASIATLDLCSSVSNDPTSLGAAIGSNQWKIHD